MRSDTRSGLSRRQAIGSGLRREPTQLRGVALAEAGSRRMLPGWARPAAGRLLVLPLAAWSPQVLSAGHSALHVDLAVAAPLGFVAGVLAAKAAASILSLGFGLRGGLFFASLFLGTLIGHIYAGLLSAAVNVSVLNFGNAALVGMAALAVAFEEGVDRQAAPGSLAHAEGEALTSALDIPAVMERFDAVQSDELGLVTETYVRRRYAEEVDKAQRSLFGEE